MSKNNLKSLNMKSEDFRLAGHRLIDRIAEFMDKLPNYSVTSAENPSTIRSLLKNQSIPMEGQQVQGILDDSMDLLFNHSLFNGHPKFWGYITSSAAPIGALADLLAASVNPNVGAFTLSPMATEIERQTVSWLAELIGYHQDCGGLCVSGGNMANFLGFLTARANKLKANIRKEGLVEIQVRDVEQDQTKTQQDAGIKDEKRRYTVYCAQGTHTWIHKATDLFGHGTDSIRWINISSSNQMDTEHLKEQLTLDLRFGHQPFMVVGNAGSVGTGVVDQLDEIATICKSFDLWFHVDGAYGAPAAALPELAELFKGLDRADSIALDPHKWLYSPLEAGCILVKNSNHLHETFNYNPEYYNFGGDGQENPVNFHEYGMQNSRGFRALKVWMSLKQVGKLGIANMIRKDILLAKELFQLIEKTSRLKAISHNLSITTFRFIPDNLPRDSKEEYLNLLNETLLNRLQSGGEVFLSNAVIDGKYCLRVCIVNFRTTYSDLQDLVKIVLLEGEKVHKELQSVKSH